jgi:hypothetical protein
VVNQAIVVAKLPFHHAQSKQPFAMWQEETTLYKRRIIHLVSCCSSVRNNSRIQAGKPSITCVRGKTALTATTTTTTTTTKY